MDRRRFSKRTAALLAAAALPGLARAQARPLDPKAEEKNAKALKGRKGPEERKAKAAEEQSSKVAGEQNAKKRTQQEEQKAKGAEEQKAKVGQKAEEQRRKGEEQKAKGAKLPAESKAKAVEENRVKAEESRAAKGRKRTSLDERRWQREQDLRRFAALRRVGKLLLG